jgi:hypothetical protein
MGTTGATDGVAVNKGAVGVGRRGVGLMVAG